MTWRAAAIRFSGLGAALWLAWHSVAHAALHTLGVPCP